MAGKRQAQSDLNHDNWDREEEPEERGTFRTATDDELKNRVIKKAKRKIAPGTASDAADGGSGAKSVFSGFSGFGKATATAATASSSPFSFLSKIPAVAAATSSNNLNSSTTTTGASPTFSFGSGSAAATTTAKTTEVSKPSSSFSFGNASATSAASAPKTSIVATSEKSPFSFSSSSEYYKKLSSLNQAVSEWVKTHVDKNPVCILSPIFKDYEKYLKEIEDEKKKEETKDSTVAKDATEKPPQSSSSAGMGSFKFSSSNNAGATPTATETTAKTNGFSFGLKKSEETSPAKPATTSSFSFGLKPSSSESSTTTATSSSTTAPSSGFSFGNLSSNTNQTDTPPKPFSFTPGATPFSFGNIKPPSVASNATGATNEDEDEEPPKNEFKQVVEDDAVYSKKCKVFVKKDGNFVDKGVGTLYLKPVESSGKTQLIVRADTNLGNILVNLILNSAVPAQRMGKNNVMMVCLPTPDVDKPTSMLLRVKTGEEADELLENIEKYKK